MIGIFREGSVLLEVAHANPGFTTIEPQGRTPAGGIRYHAIERRLCATRVEPWDSVNLTPAYMAGVFLFESKGAS